MLILWIHKYLILITMTSKVIEGHKISSNFSVNPTLSHWWFPLQIVWISLSLFLSQKISFLLHLVQIYVSFLPCYCLKASETNFYVFSICWNLHLFPQVFWKIIGWNLLISNRKNYVYTTQGKEWLSEVCGHHFLSKIMTSYLSLSCVPLGSGNIISSHKRM